MDNAGAILIAAVSGRALAASARRGGYVPLVVDFFADEDVVALAAPCIRLPDGLAHGMDGDAVIAAFDRLAVRERPCGVICGTGFEDRPHLLDRIAERWTLYGNGGQTVARVKDPVRLAALCADCGIPHPEVSLARPAQAGWLLKRIGGAGGTHIRDAEDVPPTPDPSPPLATLAGGGEDAAPGFYFQRRVAGTPVSALFLADGRRAHILGFSTQWSAPTAAQPFRYGGAVRPADIAHDAARALSDAVRRLVEATGLVGLNSADVLLGPEGLWLLEINPRPGATLDIFEPPGSSLVALHVAACEGELIVVPALAGAAAAATVYAEHDIVSFPPVAWPDWAADRPQPGSAVGAGEPLCTVQAGAATAAEARRLVAQRAAVLLAMTHRSAA